jgi:pyruvate/2-oxoglutarate dehydrogenase complex dihydrolipoamide dehydrogenase (E3) component
VGGLLLLGSVPPHKEEIRDLVFYLNGQLERENVQVQLGREMTADSVRAMKPDVVVLAAGGIPIVPEMAKVRVDGVVTALEVLSGSKPVGQEVIVIGGGLVGGETAGYLAERGKKVTLLEMTGSIGNDVGPSVLKVFVKRLKEAGVIVETRTKAIEITDKGVTCLRDDKLEFFRGATIVLAMGMRGNSRLVRELEGKGMAVSAVGDCVEPRTIAQAMESGFRVALEIT